MRCSPLELLLPNGAADGTLVLGDGCPQALAPRCSDRRASGKIVDLVIVAPSRSQRRDARWAEQAASTAAARLSGVGIAYVVPGGATRLRRALVSAGLQHAATLLNVPDAVHPRYLVPVGTVAERYALTGGIPINRRKRLIALGLGTRGRAVFGPTGTVHRRDLTVPLAAWLFDPEQWNRRQGSVLIAAQEEAQGAILYRFGGRPDPEVVGKVSPGAAAELDALRSVAPGAGAAGVHTPATIGSGRLGTLPYVVLSFLGGRRAADLVGRGEIEARQLQTWIADWLERWNRACSRIRPVNAGDLERFLFGPASRAAVDDAYLAFLKSLGERAEGRRCAFVPGHGDLTLANVLVDDQNRLGVIDWEHATEEGLPLTDFLYAGVDAVAARTRYTDRPAAFAMCFGVDCGESFLKQLRRRMATGLALDEVVQTVCFHACWLQHAANEADRSTDSRSGPFMTILQSIASMPELFGVPRRAR